MLKSSYEVSILLVVQLCVRQRGNQISTAQPSEFTFCLHKMIDNTKIM